MLRHALSKLLEDGDDQADIRTVSYETGMEAAPKGLIEANKKGGETEGRKINNYLLRMPCLIEAIPIPRASWSFVLIRPGMRSLYCPACVSYRI